MRPKARSSRRWSRSTAATSSAPPFKTLELRFADGARRRVFSHPREVIVVRDPADVRAAFVRLDAALSAGFSIAGALFYELGCHWNGLPLPAGTAELLRVGIYDGSSFEDAQPAPREGAPLEPSLAGVSAPEYDAALTAIARALHEGDAYQVNYTVPFRSRCTLAPRALFEGLAARARVPYAALLEADDTALVSLSPELFLAIDGDVVRTKPMKGTAAPDDRQSLASSKNRAEHVMIVDLLRNDLHRVCRDVRLEAFETVERYPTFATMTSTIAGRLAAPLRLETLFAATFPCGSITGAPKRAAMERIAALEVTPRGIAMGSLGFLEPVRSPGAAGAPVVRGWWNVAIRTLSIDRRAKRAELRVGGGIVADSTARDEWREIGLKRRLFRDAERAVGLIETLSAQAEPTVVEAHLERLERSAWRLGIAFEPGVVRARLASATASAAVGPALVRVHLSASGEVTCELRPFEPTPPHPLCVVAPERLDADDPLLRLKTDRRESYDSALAYARRHAAFEGLLLNAAGDLADGARTSVFVAEADGTLSTPRLEDGALDGIARRGLVASGRARERRIAGERLVPGVDVWLASSARPLFRASVGAAVSSKCLLPESGRAGVS